MISSPLHRPSLNFVVTVLSLLYLGAAIATGIQAQGQEDFQLAWILGTGLWLFLAVGTWRLNRIARTTTVTVLWLFVFGLAFVAVQPLYFAELSPVPDFPGLERLQGTPELLLGLALVALLGLRVLGKYEVAFQ